MDSPSADPALIALSCDVMICILIDRTPVPRIRIFVRAPHGARGVGLTSLPTCRIRCAVGSVRPAAIRKTRGTRRSDSTGWRWKLLRLFAAACARVAVRCSGLFIRVVRP